MRIESYTGPFPRKRHSHTCTNCKAGRGQGAVACYKQRCTKPQRIDSCECCAKLQPSATYRPPAPADPRPEVQEVAQWYTLIDEKRRQEIFSALSDLQRRAAFEYGLAVSWNRLPQYARDLVNAEWWNGRRPPAEDDGGRTLAGNTPTCEDCGRPVDHCSCEDPAAAPDSEDPWAAARRLAQLSLF